MHTKRTENNIRRILDMIWIMKVGKRKGTEVRGTASNSHGDDVPALSHKTLAGLKATEIKVSVKAAISWIFEGKDTDFRVFTSSKPT